MPVANPFFSIIIPTYNSSKTLTRCFESLRVQTFKSFEIIIIDGLSIDNSIEMVNHYSDIDKNVNWISENDTGIYDAMNKGIKLAKGKWLYFIGSDDILFDNNSIENIYSFIKSSNANVVYGNVLVKGDARWATDGDIYDKEFNLAKLLKKNICHQAIFYSADFIKNNKILYNTKYKVLADWDFNLRCWSKSSFQYIHQTIAIFNAGGSSTANIIQDSFNDDFVSNFLKYFNINPYHPLVKKLPSERFNQLIAIRHEKKIFSRIKRLIKLFLNK